MDERTIGDRLVAVLAEMDAITQQVSVDDPTTVLDDATLQVFWRDWPPLRSWAETIWQRLQADLAVPATPFGDPELDEVGGSG
jgi:hypothetical protein